MLRERFAGRIVIPELRAGARGCDLNQCGAVVLAMRAIRAVTPVARLIQTNDLARTYSTPERAYQADFENARRWIGWDLLCGCWGVARASLA